MNVKKLKMN